MQQTTKKLSKNQKLSLFIGLPLAIVLPLLIVSYLIGPGSIWIWVGVGLGMMLVSWQMRKNSTVTKKEEQDK